jgi:hypothetical protein
MTGDQEDTWKTVTKTDKKRIARGRKKKKAVDKAAEWQIEGTAASEKAHMSESELERMVSQCQLEIESSKFLAALEEAALRGPPPSSIVCYGIGNFGVKQTTPSASMWQLVCALQLRTMFQKQGVEVVMYYFEPFMTSEEAVLLEHLSLEVIRENERGRRVVKEPTVFFMPHCPLVLYSNLLFANRDCLQNLVILGNSLFAYAHRLQKSCHTRFLRKLLPFVSETTICIPNEDVKSFSGHFEQAFNDQAVIRFKDTQDLELPQTFVEEMLGEPDEGSGEVL